MPYKNKINNEMAVRVFYLYFGWNALILRPKWRRRTKRLEKYHAF
jgi:hypothetical protein